MIQGDRFTRELGTTEDTISVVITFRDLDWLYGALRVCLRSLAYEENWDTDPPENSDHWLDGTFDYVGELLESYHILDRIGEIVPYCVADYPDLPDGVLPCRGETYDREEYPLLWDRLPVALKTETTFQTPDLRGHILGAAGAYAGLSVRSVYERVGEESHTLTETEIPAHSHAYTPPVANVDLESPGAPDVFAAGLGLPTQTGSTGGDQPHNNMQPTIFLVYGIIAR